jgi:hypothetical protein
MRYVTVAVATVAAAVVAGVGAMYVLLSLADEPLWF